MVINGLASLGHWFKMKILNFSNAQEPRCLEQDFRAAPWTLLMVICEDPSWKLYQGGLSHSSGGHQMPGIR